MSCQQEQLIAFHRFCGFRGTTVDHTVLIAGGAAGDQRLAGTRKRPDVSDAPGQYVPHRIEAGKDPAALCREESHRGRTQPREGCWRGGTKKTVPRWSTFFVITCG